MLLTILSSLAQDESRSISENSTWGIRRRFEQEQHKMSTKRFWVMILMRKDTLL